MQRHVWRTEDGISLQLVFPDVRGGSGPTSNHTDAYGQGHSRRGDARGASLARLQRGETEIKANSGAQFEISIERVPRTYRDREDIAPSKRGDLRIRRVDTLEMAKTDEASWKKWKAWAKAGRGR
jgi:hypothetical protein